MLIDTTPFTDFNLFFAWYINIIKSKVEGYNVAMSSDEIHLLMGKLNKEEREFTERAIRKIQKIPKGIYLENDNSVGTFYSQWNSPKKMAKIAYPSVVYYWLRFPDMVKAVIQHEIGHIVNLDIVPNTKHDDAYRASHSACINRSMDCRINQNLNYQSLDYINRCLFTFSNVPTELLVPETWFPKCGLPIQWKGKANWTYIHDNYHKVNPEPLNEDEENFTLKIGSYVKTTIDKHGFPSGTYGRIISKLPIAPNVYDYMVIKITDEEIEALDTEDYKFFEEFDDPISVLGGSTTNISPTFDLAANEMGLYSYNKDNKELQVLQKPIVEKIQPQCGDIALTLKDINNIPQATFCIITDEVDAENGEYMLREFSDELQNIIGSGDADSYFAKIESGQEDLFTNNEEKGVFAIDFILRNLSKNGGNPPPPPPDDTKKIEKPKKGDVVVISKGDKKGKYGVIQEETEDGKYVITEVSEDVAKAMVGKKERTT